MEKVTNARAREKAILEDNGPEYEFSGEADLNFQFCWHQTHLGAAIRVQEAVDAMVKNVERENIRKMQCLVFWCSANCCEVSQASMQQVHQCIERCHAPLAQGQALVTSELERFQDHLARCTMHCNDKAKGSIDAGNEELQVKRELDSCVAKRVDDHLHLIPTMTKKMKESLSSIRK
ncbi:protein FAM136A-like [Acomys russatus]|uniref:protein FAM136A-like n=1 Tax=Acomys russatus TaxID=60746 RepID=UPI0021E2046B|nr:protein FAM136A-like [Acomys russatus]